MPSIPVEIYHDGALLEARERQLRRLPDGRVGVAYQGRIYPVIDQKRIEISGRSYLQNESPLLTKAPSEWDDLVEEIIHEFCDNLQ